LRGREVEEGRQRSQLAEDFVAVHRVHVLLVLRGEALLLPMERGHKLNLFIGNRLNDTPTYIWTYNKCMHIYAKPLIKSFYLSTIYLSFFLSMYVCVCKYLSSYVKVGC